MRGCGGAWRRWAREGLLLWGWRPLFWIYLWVSAGVGVLLRMSWTHAGSPGDLAYDLAVLLGVLGFLLHPLVIHLLMGVLWAPARFRVEEILSVLPCATVSRWVGRGVAAAGLALLPGTLALIPSLVEALRAGYALGLVGGLGLGLLVMLWGPMVVFFSGWVALWGRRWGGFGVVLATVGFWIALAFLDDGLPREMAFWLSVIGDPGRDPEGVAWGRLAIQRGLWLGMGLGLWGGFLWKAARPFLPVGAAGRRDDGRTASAESPGEDVGVIRRAPARLPGVWPRIRHELAHLGRSWSLWGVVLGGVGTTVWRNVEWGSQVSLWSPGLLWTAGNWMILWTLLGMAVVLHGLFRKDFRWRTGVWMALIPGGMRQTLAVRSVLAVLLTLGGFAGLMTLAWGVHVMLGRPGPWELYLQTFLHLWVAPLFPLVLVGIFLFARARDTLVAHTLFWTLVALHLLVGDWLGLPWWGRWGWTPVWQRWPGLGATIWSWETHGIWAVFWGVLGLALVVETVGRADPIGESWWSHWKRRGPHPLAGVLGGVALMLGVVFGNRVGWRMEDPDLERAQVAYELRWGRWDAASQPRPVAVEETIQVLPHRRAVDREIHLKAVHHGPGTLDTVLFVVDTPPGRVRITLRGRSHSVEVVDRPLPGVYGVRVSPPLAPGDTLKVAIRVFCKADWIAGGFCGLWPGGARWEGNPVRLGFWKNRGLTCPIRRRRRGLPPLAPGEDPPPVVRYRVSVRVSGVPSWDAVFLGATLPGVGKGETVGVEGKGRWEGGVAGWGWEAHRVGTWTVWVPPRPAGIWVERLRPGLRDLAVLEREGHRWGRVRNGVLVLLPPEGYRSGDGHRGVFPWTGVLQNPGSPSYRMALAHAAAHLWWGRNVQGDPRLEEVLARYTVIRLGADRWSLLEALREAYLDDMKPDEPGIRDVWVDRDHPVVKYRAPLVLWGIRGIVGDSGIDTLLLRWQRGEAPLPSWRDFWETSLSLIPEESRSMVRAWLDSVALYTLRGVEAWQDEEGTVHLVVEAGRTLRGTPAPMKEPVEVHWVTVAGETLRDTLWVRDGGVTYRISGLPPLREGVLDPETWRVYREGEASRRFRIRRSEPGRGGGGPGE